MKVEEILSDWSNIDLGFLLDLPSVQLSAVFGLSKRGLLLSRNSLSGTIPSELGRLNGFSMLALDKNLLTSTIPQEVFLLTDLLAISLAENDLVGTLPSKAMGKLQNLMYMALNGNRLSGELPEDIGHLSQLSIIDLSSNQFVGTVPNAFYFDNRYTGVDDFIFPCDERDWPKVTVHYKRPCASIDLHNNKLLGQLPEHVSPFLQYLDLSHNNFTGPIIITSGDDDAQLSYLNISSNPFVTGTIPNELCILSDLNNLNFDCSSSLCGCNCSCF